MICNVHVINEVFFVFYILLYWSYSDTQLTERSYSDFNKYIDVFLTLEDLLGRRQIVPLSLEWADIVFVWTATHFSILIIF